jgi:hypothetical protein
MIGFKAQERQKRHDKNVMSYRFCRAVLSCRCCSCCCCRAVFVLPFFHAVVVRAIIAYAVTFCRYLIQSGYSDFSLKQKQNLHFLIGFLCSFVFRYFFIIPLQNIYFKRICLCYTTCDHHNTLPCLISFYPIFHYIFYRLYFYHIRVSELKFCGTPPLQNLRKYKIAFLSYREFRER